MLYLITLWPPSWGKAKEDRPVVTVAPPPDPLKDLEARWNAEIRTIRDAQDRERKQFVEALAQQDKEVSGLRAYVNMLQTSDATHTQQLMDMNGIVGALREQNTELSDRAKAQRIIIDELKLEIATLRQTVALLTDEKVKAVHIAQTAEAKAGFLERENNSLRQENQALRRELGQVR